MSKERSTPEGINLDDEEHARRFGFSFPEPPTDLPWKCKFSLDAIVMKGRKPKAVRYPLCERRVADRRRVVRNRAEVALRKYNRANNTKVFLSFSAEV